MSQVGLGNRVVDGFDACWVHWIVPAALPLVVLALLAGGFDLVCRRRWPGAVAHGWTLVALVALWPWVPRWFESSALTGDVSDGALSMAAVGQGLASAAWLGRGLVATSGLLLVVVLGRALQANRAWLRGCTESRAVGRRCEIAAQTLRVRALPVRIQPVSARMQGPVLVGWLRPTIVLPRWATTDRAVLDGVLLHELAHHARRDPLAEWVLVVLRAVFWWHPASWCVAARQRRLRELACDRLVVCATGRREAYRSALIECARRQLRLASGTLAISGRPVVVRLKALRFDPPTGAKMPRWARSALALAAVSVIACARVALQPVGSPAAPAAVPTAESPVPPPVTVPDGPGCFARRFAVLAALHRAESRSE